MLTNFPSHAKAPATAAVIGESGLIHRYMRYSMKTRNPFELAALWWKLVRLRPDYLVYLMPVRPIASVRRDAAFFRMAGVRNIVGLPSENELTHKVDPSTGTFEREASRLARAIGELGDAQLDRLENWDLRLTAAERAKAAEVLRGVDRSRVIVCAPGTKMQAKDWGTQNWAALMGKLSRAIPQHTLVLAGAREEIEVCEAVGRGWNGNVVNLCGKLTPRETAAAMEGADVFTGPDSGPMHLAASVGVPCAIAFSARGRPGIWYPAGEQNAIVYHKVDCFGCNLETCIAEAKKCMTSISVEEMYEAVVRARKGALQSA